MINSRPEIEKNYLEDIDLLKKVIKGYYNQNQKSITKKVESFNELKKHELLTQDCSDIFVFKDILKANDLSVKKGEFSEKFFNQALKQKSPISIVQRIELIIPV